MEEKTAKVTITTSYKVEYENTDELYELLEEIKKLQNNTTVTTIEIETKDKILRTVI